MFDWIRKRAKLILLFTTLIVLIFIMAQIVHHSGLMSRDKKASVSITSMDSGDSPPSIEYFFIKDVSPDDAEVRWKDIQVLTKDPCTPAHEDECPKYEKMTEGVDYKIVDRDMDNKVSEEDTVQVYLAPSDAWNKDIAFKWKETGAILYQERLPGP